MTGGGNDPSSNEREIEMMTNELNFDDLDGVVGGTGSLSDVLTYVKAYNAALGDYVTGSVHCNYTPPPAPCHPK
jgi:hypothetical protein